MLYDNGFTLSGNTNATAGEAHSLVHPAADAKVLEGPPDARSGEVVSETATDVNIRHEIPQHSNRTYHQT